ncbi:MAG: chromate transporter [Thermosynechococcaceae cyanobacterium MS004]|nr:chromate transporter [Thermosynechococcaceae cyanobacterium MS004]
MTPEPESNPQEQTSYSSLSAGQQRQRLGELASVFLRLGVLAFGGPAAHIAMMDEEVVERRRWFSREDLLDLIGVTNLIPGPNSTELAIHIGYARAGWRGLLIAGSCFILPAMGIVWTLAIFYQRFQTIPQVQWLLYGLKPVIIAIVLQAVWGLGKKALKDFPTAIAGILAVIAYLSGFNEVLLLLLLGTAVMLIKNWHRQGAAQGVLLLPVSEVLAQSGASPEIASASGMAVFLAFLKIGSVLYGSGYVLLAFLQRDLVEQNQWLTSQQLLDAIAIGQFTPGPVFTTATFIGYLVAGHGGAIAGTIGIFLPAFLLVWAVTPWVPKLKQSPWVRGFLDGVNAASLGLMAGVTWTIAQSALVDALTLAVAIVSIIAAFRFKVNATWLLLGGASVGFLSHLLK